MKYSILTTDGRAIAVAPLVGAWIEIVMLGVLVWFKFVAPLVGAWIEIQQKADELFDVDVAPLVGAWIEISNTALNVLGVFRRSSCRSVD